MAPNSGCLLAICTIEGRVKLYHQPFCDFRAEWIEVIDMSDKLYDYLASDNFGELEICSLETDAEQATECGFPDDLPKSLVGKEHKRKRRNCSRAITKGLKSFKDDQILDLGSSENNSDDSSHSTEMEGEWIPKVSDKVKKKDLHQTIRKHNSKVKSSKQTADKRALPLITPLQYASRNAKLSSLVVAWSPILWISSKISPFGQGDSSNRCSILAVGGKAGEVSFWKIHAPQCYSVEHSKNPCTVMFSGILRAHHSWITTISWALHDSRSQILLATGSSDGSVKIWLGSCEELLKLSDVKSPPFSLLKEVTTVNVAPVSVLSLMVPVQSPQDAFLAVGKGCGSFEVWVGDMSCQKFEKRGSYDAHNHVITGLAWAFDGRCLYSCSQDNFVRSWVLHGSSLFEVPIPSNTPGLRSSTDLPDAFFSCHGVAVSPGNLVLAMVRGFDVDLLDKMYQVRAMKAAVEFLWIGGQQVDMLPNTSPDFEYEAFPGFPEKELMYWESNFLWSIKQFEDQDRPLVIWDIIAALLAFKQSEPKYVQHLVVRWLLKTFLKSQAGLSVEKILSRVSKCFFKISSRRLHLLNIICRRVMLSELPADQINFDGPRFRESTDEEGQMTLWMKLLLRNERELRERLVGFSFSVYLSLISHSATNFSQTANWCPSGLAQMEQWVGLTRDHVRDQLKGLASKVGKHGRRRRSSEYVAEEACSYCSGSVLFDSPEVAFCQGLEIVDGVSHSHKLPRCSVSMQVCPATPLWFCKCCHRWTSKLAPETLFTMIDYSIEVKSLTDSSDVEVLSRPLCPFCGILLQKLQAEFLLSPTPV
ncbi:uncharacterized protein LOC119984946 isoform X2 [Tripterygium wilfordii]|nr:uncharacterized protein LOC119984946 isoform X2 [Tripterygium wilfordii]